MDDDAWIKDMLRRAPVGYLATVHRDQPYVNSNLFVYDEDSNCIYMHTAAVGRTASNVDGGANAKRKGSGDSKGSADKSGAAGQMAPGHPQTMPLTGRGTSFRQQT